MTLNEMIERSIRAMEGATVTITDSTVEIRNGSMKPIFMQGEDADEFIKAVDALIEHNLAGISDGQCALHVAKDYVDAYR